MNSKKGQPTIAKGQKRPANMKSVKNGNKNIPAIPGGKRQKGGPGKAGIGGGAFDIGSIGPFRLFQSSLGPQISWLLPFAIIGLIGGLVFYRDRRKRWYSLTHKQKQLILWTSWLVPVYGFFSVASFFHPYYTIMLHPQLRHYLELGSPPSANYSIKGDEAAGNFIYYQSQSLRPQLCNHGTYMLTTHG